jgi:hypothetical protein
MRPILFLSFPFPWPSKQAIVLDYDPVSLVALVGKAKGMHGEIEVFQFSTFVGFGCF